MKTQDILYLLGGLVIGIVIAMIVFNDDADALDADTLRTVVEDAVANETSQLQADLTQLSEAVAALGSDIGNPQTRNPEQLGYFSIPYGEVESWLGIMITEADDPDAALGADLMANLGTVGEISTSTDLILYFDNQTDVVDNVLSTVYAALIEQTGSEDTSVCLAVDSNPYSLTGTGLYIYVEIPEELIDEMPKASEGWEQLAERKENSMTWASECYEPPDVAQ